MIKLLMCASMLFLAATAQAATWHVATNGSDQNEGTAAQLLQSWQAAVDRAMPGDRILIRPGTYPVTGKRGHSIASGEMVPKPHRSRSAEREVVPCSIVEDWRMIRGCIVLI